MFSNIKNSTSSSSLSTECGSYSPVKETDTIDKTPSLFQRFSPIQPASSSLAGRGSSPSKYEKLSQGESPTRSPRDPSLAMPTSELCSVQFTPISEESQLNELQRQQNAAALLPTRDRTVDVTTGKKIPDYLLNASD